MAMTSGLEYIVDIKGGLWRFKNNETVTVEAPPLKPSSNVIINNLSITFEGNIYDITKDKTREIKVDGKVVKIRSLDSLSKCNFFVVTDDNKGLLLNDNLMPISPLINGVIKYITYFSTSHRNGFDELEYKLNVMFLDEQNRVVKYQNNTYVNISEPLLGKYIDYIPDPGLIIMSNNVCKYSTWSLDNFNVFESHVEILDAQIVVYFDIEKDFKVAAYLLRADGFVYEFINNTFVKLHQLEWQNNMPWIKFVKLDSLNCQGHISICNASGHCYSFDENFKMNPINISSTIYKTVNVKNAITKV